jgi:hypothetical protein
LEGQRVRLLTEGYLRGWLTFDYPNSSSYVREEIILNYIEDERLYELLKNRLTVETILRSTLESKNKNLFDPIYKLAGELIGLKLPLLKPKDKIKNAPNPNTAATYSREQIDEWKKILAEINKK